MSQEQIDTVRRKETDPTNLLDVPSGPGIMCDSKSFYPVSYILLPFLTAWDLITVFPSCLDMRFTSLRTRVCELGAHTLSLPSAFTALSDMAHWNTLLRAVAIKRDVVDVIEQWLDTHLGQETTTYVASEFAAWNEEPKVPTWFFDTYKSRIWPTVQVDIVPLSLSRSLALSRIHTHRKPANRFIVMVLPKIRKFVRLRITSSFPIRIPLTWSSQSTQVKIKDREVDRFRPGDFLRTKRRLSLSFLNSTVVSVNLFRSRSLFVCSKSKSCWCSGIQRLMTM